MKKLNMVLLMFLFSFIIFGCDKECNHQWGEWKVITYPTCESAGEKISICDLCSKSKIEQMEKLYHSFGDIYIEHDSKHYHSCMICGYEEYVKENDIPSSDFNDQSHFRELLPGSQSFELIYSSNFPNETSLTNVTEEIIAIFKDISNKGYVFRIFASSKYSGLGPMEFTIGVNVDGKITGIKCDVYKDTKELLSTFLPSFIGKDSALTDVEVTGGTTYSSRAIKASVENAMNCLIANGLIAEGIKSPERILTDLIPSVHSGLVTIDGSLKCEKTEGTGNIVTIYEAENGSGYAYIMSKGDAYYLAVTNNLGKCKVYDVEGNDVTSANTDLAQEALTHTADNGASYLHKLTYKVNSMMAGVNNITSVEVDAFNTVVSAVSFEFEEATYYAFYAKSYGYQVMDVYYIIDAEGKIVKMNADTFIFDEEYFFAFGGMPDGYQAGFNGLTSETFDGSQAIIASATLSSNAIKEATYDIFESFESLVFIK